MIIRKKKSFENEPQQKKKKRKKETISNYTSYKYEVASQGNQRNEKLPARRVLRRKRRQSCRHLIRSNSLVVCNPNWLLRHLPHWKRGTRFCLLSKTGPGPSIFKLLPISHPRFSFHVFRSRKRSRATGKTNGEPPKKEFSGGKKTQRLSLRTYFNFSSTTRTPRSRFGISVRSEDSELDAEDAVKNYLLV